MIRFLNVAMVVLLVASAVAVYSIKYESTIEVEKIARISRAIEAERDKIAALQAEYAARSQPARLETLAKAHLDLHPMRVDQIIALTDLPDKPAAGDVIADKLKGLGLADDPVVTGSTP